MNPLSLLTKGRSLKGLQKKGLYKLPPRDGLLPTFNTGRLAVGKGQSAVTPVPTAPEPAQASFFEPAPLPPKVIEAGLTASIPTEKPAECAPVVVAAKPALPRENIWQRALVSGKSLLQRLILGRKSRAFPGRTVQAELALGKLTVMRNDLNEDDLEVVLVEKKTGSGGKPLARLSKLEMPGEAWIKLTSALRKKSGDNALQAKVEKKEAPEFRAHATR